MEKITAIRDTREHASNGYTWQENDWCDGYITQKLNLGDYSIVGYENILAIERKASTAEFAMNVNEKRFDKELAALSLLSFPFIICEFSFDDILSFPVNSGIPSYKWKYLKVTPQYLVRKITEYQIKYNIKILFCGNKDNAWQMVNSIFKRVIEWNLQKSPKQT